MARSYDAQSIVDLPRFDAPSAGAVARALVAAAVSDKKPAANVAAALKRVERANETLSAALSAAVPNAPESDLGPALRAEANAWSGVASWLQGFAQLEGKPQAAAAERLLAALYPDGLRFVRGTASRRWSETESRLKIVDEKGLAHVFAELGGSDLLQHLRDTHKATGAAAGITVARPATEAPGVRGKFDVLKSALRAYVLQVAANAALDDTPAAAALADQLLEPLRSFELPAHERPVPVDKPVDKPVAVGV